MAVVERSFTVMASETLMILVDAPEGCAAAVQEHLCHLEECWSRFIPSSDVTRLNLAGGQTRPVDRDTIHLLGAMSAAWRETEHRFDPTILPALLAAGYRTSTTDPGRRTELPSSTRAHGDLGSIVVDSVEGTAELPTGMAIDAGGIGKGLAADLAVAKAISLGASGALVSVGGDLAMAGRPPGPEGWFVTVEQPDPGDGDLCTLSLRSGGVATSSTWSRRWVLDGEQRHQVIDPTNDLPSTTDLVTATVVAPTGWQAEAHATAALLGGSEGFLDYLARHGLSGVAVARDGRHFSSEDIDPADLLPSHAFVEAPA